MRVRRLSDEKFLWFVGGEISSKRHERGLSQEDLAELSGLHRNSIGRIERGECDASIVLLSYLYFNLGCTGVTIDKCGVVPQLDCVNCVCPPELAGMRPATMIRILGDLVRGRRTDMRLSLRETANISGVHLNSIWNFETGIVCPTITTYFHLLRTLEVTAVSQSEGIPFLH